MLNHLLTNREGLRVAVIVNDMSEVGIDAALVRDGGAALSRTEERLVEMVNGCICCTLRDDLLAEVERLAREGRFDYLLIESSGISEPLPVAATFSFPRDDGATLSDIARLDTMVTVVDVAGFLPELQRGDELAERDLDQYPDDERTISDLLIDQIEFPHPSPNHRPSWSALRAARLDSCWYSARPIWSSPSRPTASRPC